MADSTLSILGLYQHDNTIFDDFTLPENVSHETLINNILMECAEFEILYPDPIFLKFAISEWSKKEFSRWLHLYETTLYEYNPIENYDRYEDFSEKGKSTGKSSSSSTSAGTTNNSVSAFDSSDFKNSEKTENSDTGNNIGSSENNNENTRTGHLHGNIGVTTTQQMIQQEREAIINLYDIIISDFKKRFCIIIY